MRYTTVILLFMTFTLFSAQVSLTGNVTFSDGTPVAGVTVAVPTTTGQEEVITDAAGNYSFSLEEGTYDELRIRNMGGDIPGIPNMMEYQAVAPLVLAGNTVQDVQLLPMPTMAGIISDTDGTPLQNTRVQLMRWYNDMNQLPSDESTTNSAGEFDVVCDTGMIQLTITPPESRSDLTIHVDTFRLANDTTVNYQFEAAPVVTGQVLSHRGDTVRNITVALVQNGNQKEMQTDSDGWFSFAVALGTIQELRVRNMGQDVDLVPNMMEYTAKENWEFTATETVMVTLPPYHRISGTLYDADSVILTEGKASSAAWDGSWKQNPTDEDQVADDGTFTLYVADGATRLTFTPSESNNFAEEERTETIISDTAINFYLKPSVTFKGSVHYWDSTPVSGITVALSNGQKQYEQTTAMDGTFEFTLEPGIYPDFRIRSMGNNIDKLPNMMEYTVDETGIDLSNSDSMKIVLPPFYRVHGTVQNVLEQPLGNMTLYGSAWESMGVGLPSDEITTMPDGMYELYLQGGMNRITVTNDGSVYASLVFFIELDSSVNKDITVAYQAKGVSRVQPSVVSWGESGSVTFTGVNTSFLGGVDSISLGEGVTVSNIEVISDITIVAELTVDSSAEVGTRSAAVFGTDTVAGAELFTVTAPVEETFILDSESKTTQDIVISDGTGTDITVDSGTVVTLPAGVTDTMLSFVAPILENDTIDPADKEFLQVQRDFYPDGVTFDPPAEITFHYSDQDVEGIDEEKLTTFKFDDVNGEIVGEYEVIDRDTANNILVQKATGFSLYRLAAPTGTSSTGPEAVIDRKAEISSVNSVTGYLSISYVVPGSIVGETITFALYKANGQMVAKISDKIEKAGVNRFNLYKKSLGTGIYLLRISAGDVDLKQKILAE